MSTEDARWAADLHRAELPHGLFPALGARFLQEYLTTYVHSPAAAALVADVDGRPAGYLVGPLDHRRHRAHVIQVHRRALAVRGAFALLRRPTVAWRFIRTRLPRYASALLRPRPPAAGDAAGDGRVAVLAHVAVLSDERSAGAGSALVRAFTESARGAGATRCELVTRADDGPVRFYERLGWERLGESRDRDGVLWTRLGLDLEPPRSEPSPPS